MPIIKVKCKVCGKSKSKWSTCKDPLHNKIIDEKLSKLTEIKPIFDQSYLSGTH